MVAANGKIVIVDDSADDRFWQCHTLKKIGLADSIVEIEDGEKAIDYLKREFPPVLLLLDLKMPRISGFEVLEWIRARPELQGMSIVVMSHSVIPADKQRALQLGAKDFFTKTDYHGMCAIFADLAARFLKGEREQ